MDRLCGKAKFKQGKIFISHSSVDKPIARRLAKRLQNRGYSVWLDEKEIQLGDPLSDTIAAALSETPVLIALISRHSISSRWVQFEINHAVQRQIQGHARVIPLRIDDVEVPPTLAGILYGDLGSGSRRTYAHLWRTLETIPEIAPPAGSSLRSTGAASVGKKMRAPGSPKTTPRYSRHEEPVESIFGPLGRVSLRNQNFTHGVVATSEDRHWVVHYEILFFWPVPDTFDVDRFVSRAEVFEQYVDCHAHLLIVEEESHAPLILANSRHAFSKIAARAWEALSLEGPESPVWVVTTPEALDDEALKSADDDLRITLAIVRDRIHEVLKRAEVRPLTGKESLGPLSIIIDL